MDIHVDIRGFLEIHAWICYGFSDQGGLPDYKWWTLASEKTESGGERGEIVQT